MPDEAPEDPQAVPRGIALAAILGAAIWLSVILAWRLLR
jgi:hypothetical protein